MKNSDFLGFGNNVIKKGTFFKDQYFISLNKSEESYSIVFIYILKKHIHCWCIINQKEIKQLLKIKKQEQQEYSVNIYINTESNILHLNLDEKLKSILLNGTKRKMPELVYDKPGIKEFKEIFNNNKLEVNKFLENITF